MKPYDCKRCGAKHGMVIENMVSGEVEPIDLCKDCLFMATYIPIKEQIKL